MIKNSQATMGPILDKSKLEKLKQELEKLAVRYLARYSTSEKNLRSNLIKNLYQRGYINKTIFDLKDIDPSIHEILENIIIRFRNQGALNDKNFAEGKILIYRRMGRSRQTIQQLLIKKGIDQNIIQSIFASEVEGDEDFNKREFEAALIFAKRRRLGPYHRHNKEKIDPQKDLAKLIRAGYSIEISREVMRYKA